MLPAQTMTNHLLKALKQLVEGKQVVSSIQPGVIDPTLKAS